MNATRSRTCPTCSAPMDPRRAYCSPGCQPECAVDGCSTPVKNVRTPICELHRSRRRGGLPDWRTCNVCGVQIEDRPKKSKVCSEHNQCSVPGCAKPIWAKGACAKHSKHAAVYGTTHTPCATCGQPIDRGPGQHVYCSEACRPVCAHPTCDRPARGAGSLCDSHRVQFDQHGELRPDTWARNWVCEVCGREVEKGSGRRKHCSGRCQALASAYPEGRPRSFDCISCGRCVSLIEPITKAGQFRRVDTKLCDKCRRAKRYGMTVHQLAERDGGDCGICTKPVDMGLGFPDLMRASVDHIYPRSRGGTDHPMNLQLAHLICNIRKNNSIPSASETA